MSAENTIVALHNYCYASTKTEYTWRGNSATYCWTLGKETDDGTVNGVVRKLAGSTADGVDIWVVAGSFKIAADGSIKRFTGISKKIWPELSGVQSMAA